MSRETDHKLEHEHEDNRQVGIGLIVYILVVICALLAVLVVITH